MSFHIMLGLSTNISVIVCACASVCLCHFNLNDSCALSISVFRWHSFSLSASLPLSLSLFTIVSDAVLVSQTAKYLFDERLYLRATVPSIFPFRWHRIMPPLSVTHFAHFIRSRLQRKNLLPNIYFACKTTNVNFLVGCCNYNSPLFMNCARAWLLCCALCCSVAFEIRMLVAGFNTKAPNEVRRCGRSARAADVTAKQSVWLKVKPAQMTQTFQKPTQPFISSSTSTSPAK